MAIQGGRKATADEARASAIRRLMHDWRQLQREPLATIAAAPLEQDIFEWHANLFPSSGPYAFRAIFHCVLKFPLDYPTSPPTVRLCSKMPHPNVFGAYICLNMLDKQSPTRDREAYTGWNGCYTVQSLLQQLQSFLFAENIPQYLSWTTRGISSNKKVEATISSADQFACDQDRYLGLSSRPVIPRTQNPYVWWGHCGHTASSPFPAHPGQNVKSEQIQFHNLCHVHRLLTDSQANGQASGLLGDVAQIVLAYAYAGAANGWQRESPVDRQQARLQNMHARTGRPADGKDRWNSVPGAVAHQVFQFVGFADVRVLKQVCSFFCNVVDRYHMQASRELLCYFRKVQFDQDIVGYGIEVVYYPGREGSNPKELHTTMDLVCKGAFHQDGLRHSASNEKFTNWLPLVINHSHMQRAITDMERSFICMGGHEAFTPSLGLRYISKLMNTMVVDFMISRDHADIKTDSQKLVDQYVLGGQSDWDAMESKYKGDSYDFEQDDAYNSDDEDNFPRPNPTMHHSEKALAGYCAWHHMLLAFADRYPEIVSEAQATVHDFLQYPECRHKRSVPDLGEFMVYLCLCDDLVWRDLAITVLLELFTRNALWALRKYPELADIREYSGPPHNGPWAKAKAKADRDRAEGKVKEKPILKPWERRALGRRKEGLFAEDLIRGRLQDGETMEREDVVSPPWGFRGVARCYRLRKTWRASLTGLRLMMFQVFFLDLVRGEGLTRSEQLARYNRRLGQPPPDATSKLLAACKIIMQADDWSVFFDRLQVARLPPIALEKKLKRAILASGRAGYHRLHRLPAITRTPKFCVCIDGQNGKNGKNGHGGRPGEDGEAGGDGQNQGRAGRGGKGGKGSKGGKGGLGGYGGRPAAGGVPGLPGWNGEDGLDGLPGKDGLDGKPGQFWSAGHKKQTARVQQVEEREQPVVCVVRTPTATKHAMKAVLKTALMIVGTVHSYSFQSHTSATSEARVVMTKLRDYGKRLQAEYDAQGKAPCIYVGGKKRKIRFETPSEETLQALGLGASQSTKTAEATVNGKDGRAGKDGQDGQDGEHGRDGADGRPCRYRFPLKYDEPRHAPWWSVARKLAAPLQRTQTTAPAATRPLSATSRAPAWTKAKKFAVTQLPVPPPSANSNENAPDQEQDKHHHAKANGKDDDQDGVKQANGGEDDGWAIATGKKRGPRRTKKVTGGRRGTRRERNQRAR